MTCRLPYLKETINYIDSIGTLIYFGCKRVVNIFLLLFLLIDSLLVVLFFLPHSLFSMSKVLFLTGRLTIVLRPQQKGSRNERRVHYKECRKKSTPAEEQPPPFAPLTRRNCYSKTMWPREG